MQPVIDSALWRRIDAPGHDACRLTRSGDGWRLEGAAVYSEGSTSATMLYELTCDGSWTTLRGKVSGWIGLEPREAEVVRAADGTWKLNGAAVAGLDDCLHLDLGFTPATNLTQIRAAALEVNGRADVPVAWLDIGKLTLERLEQRYERRAPEYYWYEAPRFGYAELLRVSESGFVRNYPRLWEAFEKY